MSNENTNNKEGEEMFRNVLFTMVCGLLLGGGLIGCGGGDSTPPGGGAVAGEDEGTVCKADAADGCAAGEGEGSPNDGEGSSEGEGEGPLPSGADGEPCGGASGNECQDGLECLTCEEAGLTSADGDRCWIPKPTSEGDSGEYVEFGTTLCTCPQWFAGAWWAEFEPRAVGYEYDFSWGLEAEFWADQEIEFKQEGCEISAPDTFQPFGGGDGRKAGRLDLPDHFLYESYAPWSEYKHWMTFTGTLQDRNVASGACEGEWSDRSTEPTTWFQFVCNFSLTRR